MTAESRNSPVCSPVHTITGYGTSPVSRHSATRSGVHSFGRGRTAGGNSTSFATFTSNSPSFTAGLRIARNDSLIRCSDDGPTGRCHFTAAILRGSPLARYSAITSLWSTIASNIASRCPTRSRSRRILPRCGRR
ncbi:hypothetical protein ACFPN7_25270 [Amycolatopsis halotolerans]|uniref:hypothetical protein n=1 Tax=Amycolatopsis halotolerans TaxID=330083 RepID=UPI0036148AF0